jgi:FkbM family methyltransferase
MNLNKVVKKYSPGFLLKILRKLRESTSVKLLRKRQSFRLKSFTQESQVYVLFDNTKVVVSIKPNNGGVDNYIFLNSIHEPDILKIIKDNVKEGDVVVDVGANIGQHTIFMTRFVGDSGFVYSFEPLLTNTDSIRKSLTLNNSTNAKVETMAVGEKNTRVKMYVPETANDRSSRELVGSVSDKYVEVEMITLDTYFKEKKIDFIKIDTEGFESEVLSGAREIISKYMPTILLEYAPKFYESRNVDGNNLLSNLIAQNYLLTDVSSGYGEIDDVVTYTDFLTKGGSGISNILATDRSAN